MTAGTTLRSRSIGAAACSSARGRGSVSRPSRSATRCRAPWSCSAPSRWREAAAATATARGGRPGRSRPSTGGPGADPTWAATLDTLRPPRRRDQKLADWRREAPIRPVVFEDAGVLGDDTVHLHLEQRVAQRLLARFRAQGFVHHDLSRACLAQARDSIPRVVLLGRLCLYGRRAERLHEEIVPLAARWVEPARRSDPLRAYAREAEARTLQLLEQSLAGARTGRRTRSSGPSCWRPRRATSRSCCLSSSRAPTRSPSWRPAG